jgi:hypothetical protein
VRRHPRREQATSPIQAVECMNTYFRTLCFDCIQLLCVWNGSGGPSGGGAVERGGLEQGNPATALQSKVAPVLPPQWSSRLCPALASYRFNGLFVKLLGGDKCGKVNGQGSRRGDEEKGKREGDYRIMHVRRQTGTPWGRPGPPQSGSYGVRSTLSAASLCSSPGRFQPHRYFVLGFLRRPCLRSCGLWRFLVFFRPGPDCDSEAFVAAFASEGLLALASFEFLRIVMAAPAPVDIPRWRTKLLAVPPERRTRW